MDLHAYLSENSSSALARAVGVRPDQVSQWRSRWQGREPSPEKCVLIERATDGAVRRWDLRPNDWHLIWPEIIGDAGAPDVPEGRPLLDIARRREKAAA
jgi:DNA-binding transcriptional regulator YdaS (Cro superfamily)